MKKIALFAGLAACFLLASCGDDKLATKTTSSTTTIVDTTTKDETTTATDTTTTVETTTVETTTEAEVTTTTKDPNESGLTDAGSYDDGGNWGTPHK